MKGMMEYRVEHPPICSYQHFGIRIEEMILNKIAQCMGLIFHKIIRYRILHQNLIFQ